LKEYAGIKDFTGARKSIIDIRNYSNDQPVSANILNDIDNYNPDNHYISVSRKENGTGKKFGGGETGQEIMVEGIPVDVNTVTLKTDGVICTALLDTTNALETYKLKMQEQALEKEKAANEATRAEAQKHELAQELIMTGTDEQVGRFVDIYGSLEENEPVHE
jgi:hypothetical protein